MQFKKGIMLGEAFGAVLTLVLISVLVIISIYLFVTLNNSMTTSTAANTAITTMITQFGTFPALIGLVGTIIFLALVIGVLVTSFMFRGKRGA
jgi:hypothetical protein